MTLLQLHPAQGAPQSAAQSQASAKSQAAALDTGATVAASATATATASATALRPTHMINNLGTAMVNVGPNAPNAITFNQTITPAMMKAWLKKRDNPSAADSAALAAAINSGGNVVTESVGGMVIDVSALASNGDKELIFNFNN